MNEAAQHPRIPDAEFAEAAQRVLDAASNPVPDSELQQPTQPEEEAHREILDKKQFHAALDTAVAESHETGKPLAVLIIDVNAFKSINDEIGHETGDVTIEDLRGIIGLIANNLRTEASEEQPERQLDVVSVTEVETMPPIPVEGEHIDSEGGHIGGDEFGIVCYTDSVGAQIIANRLRQIFDEYLDQPANARLKELGVGLAIGTSSLDPGSGITGSDLLRAADRAMYEDKRRQLRPLSEEEQRFLDEALELLAKAGVRPRDLIKYVNLSDS